MKILLEIWKKWKTLENFEAAVALNFCYYNFVK